MSWLASAGAALGALVTWLAMALGALVGTILSPFFWLLGKAGLIPRRNRGPRA